MKYILIASIFLSTSAFAIDFNKVTGTFDVEGKSESATEDTVAAAAYGSFNFTEDKTRAPASAETNFETSAPGMNDVTGTFQ